MAEAYSLSFHTVGGNQNAETQLETGYQIQKSIMIASIPICILGLLGNGVVLLFLWCRIRKTKFTVYFLNMAVADLIVLFYYITVFIFFLNEVPISLFYLHIMELAHAFGFNASTYILTAISVERYFMIFFPVWYKNHRPKHLSEIMCTLLWTLSCLMSVVLYCTCYVQFDPSLTEVNSICEPAKMVRVIVNLLVFLPIMAFCTFHIFIVMLRTREGSSPEKIDITLVATVLLFLLFAASVRIIDIIARWVPKIHIPVVFLVLHFLDAIDSSGNPIVYFCVGYTKKEDAGGNFIETFLERAFMDDQNWTSTVTWAPGTK